MCRKLQINIGGVLGVCKGKTRQIDLELSDIYTALSRILYA